MSITRDFTIYLNAGISVPPVVHVNQYDQGEIWRFTLLEADGSQYTPSTGALIGVKADGHAIAGVTGTVLGDGRVQITETQQMTAAAGDAIFELTIDGQTHGTANFIVRVEKKPTDDAILSDSDLSIIQEGMNSVTPVVIAETVSDWLEDNLTDPPIDPSLTISNAAADAKVTGDKITELKNAIKHHDKGNTTFRLYGNFQHYGLFDNGTFWYNQQYRVSNDDPMTFDRDLIVNVIDGFRWGFIPFVDGIAGSWSGWKSSVGAYKIPAGTSFVVQIARVTEDTSEIADVAEFTNAVTFTTATQEELNQTNKNLKSVKTAVNLSVETTVSDWEQGGINGTNGYNTSASDEPIRIRTKECIPFESDEGIYIQVESGYGYGVIQYDANKSGNGVYTPWLRESRQIKPAENSRYYRLVIAKGGYLADNILIDEFNKINVTTVQPRLERIYPPAKYQYFGDSIPSSVPSYSFEKLFTISYPGGDNSQDIDVFDNYLFMAFTLNHINVYSLTDYSKVAEISVETNHGSQMQFSNEYYAEGDPFPLLYCGGWTNNIINVIRITNTDDVWSAEIVRKLYIPTENGYYLAPTIDKLNNILYCFGNKIQSTSHENNGNVIVKCDLSNLTTNGDGTYTPQILEEHDIPWTGTFQGGKYFNGKMYVGFARTGTPHDARLVVFDVNTGEKRADIDMTPMTLSETEGVCYRFKDGLMTWLYTDYFNIFDLTFYD